MSLQRARVRSSTSCTQLVEVDRRELQLRLALAIELAHARHRLRDVVDRALDDLEMLAARVAEAGFALQQRFGVQRHRRNRVVDVVRDAARHLPQRAQPLLLHAPPAASPQIVVGLAQ